MNIVCTDDIYSAIRYDISDVVHVYIDSSFDTNVKHLPQNELIDTALGFTMMDKYERLAGYGVVSLHTPPTRRSEIAELRGILYFFSLMVKHFPNEYTADTKFIIHNDNRPLMHMLTDIANNNHGKFNERTRHFLQNIGSNKNKIFKILRDFNNVEFRWVKGHANNPFNNMAHHLALQCYQSNHRNRPFVRAVRMHSIEKSLTKFHAEMATDGTKPGLKAYPTGLPNTIGEALQGN